MDAPIQPEVISETPRSVTAKPWGFWATIGLSLAVILAMVTVQIITVIGYLVVRGWLYPQRGLSQLAQEAKTSGLLLSLAVWASLPFCLGLTLLFARLRRGWTVGEYLGLKPVPKRTMLGWLGLLLVFLAASEGLSFLLGRPIVPEFMSQAYRSAYYLPLLWAALLVAAPLSEEVLFRGFMIPGIRHSRLGAVGAITITSAAWSLMHVQYDVYAIVQIFLGGILFGVARLKTQSLYPTLAMHSLWNLLAMIEVTVSESLK
jgi:membrane protease YdiL (CAAX protease family)